MEPSALLVGEVVCLLALAVVGTVLAVGDVTLPWPGRRRRRARPSEVPVVLFCPRIRRPANITLAATVPRERTERSGLQPELSVVDCEYLSRTGLTCDFACLEEQPRAPS